MDLVSIYRVEFIAATGATWLLLDYGDDMSADLELGTDQQTAQYSSSGAYWSFGFGTGAARRSISWSRTQDHASLTASRTFCQTHPARMPYNVPGKLRISIQNGPVFDHLSAFVSGTSPQPRMDSATFETLTSYRASAGKTVPVSGLPLVSGLPISWQLEPIGSITTPIGSL